MRNESSDSLNEVLYMVRGLNAVFMSAVRLVVLGIAMRAERSTCNAGFVCERGARNMTQALIQGTQRLVKVTRFVYVIFYIATRGRWRVEYEHSA